MRSTLVLLFIGGLCQLGSAQSFGAAGITCVTSSCHGAIKAGPVVHGPVKAKGCTVCHRINPKAEGVKDQPKHVHLDPLKGEKVNEVCLVCHDDLKDAMDLTLAKNGTVHKAIESMYCTGCHNPHSSKEKFLLLEKAAPELCYSCHSEIEDAQKKYKSHHKALNEKDSCLNCHTHHYSKEPKLLRTSVGKTCLKCHDKPEGEGAVSIHKPVAEGKCSACHGSHGSVERKLLKKPFNSGFYVPFSEGEYALCFKCHKSALATKQDVSDETRFKNGKKNLHFFHIQEVGKSHERGRGCRACHEVHGSKQEALIQPWTPSNEFGEKEVLLPMTFKKTPTGGTCATACHKLKTYDRENEFKNEEGR